MDGKTWIPVPIGIVELESKTQESRIIIIKIKSQKSWIIIIKIIKKDLRVRVPIYVWKTCSN